MRKFFKYVFASTLGFIIAQGVLMLILIGLIASLASEGKSKKEFVLKENSVYHLKFNRQISEREGKDPFADLDFGPFSEASKMGLRNIVQSIKYAATDDNIEGIYLEASGFPGGLSAMEEVRNALIEFKASGKWIVAYSEGYSQGGYYLSSVADKVYLYPEGDLYFKGLATNIMYMKGLFEKLDIEMQAIKGPDNIYKSAVEPMTKSEMSEPNREQISKYLNSIWSHWLAGISVERNISVDQLNAYADSLSTRTPEMAKSLGFVDGLMYEDEVMDEIASRLMVDAEDDIEWVSYKNYKEKKIKTSESFNDKRVAVIFANGEIRSGKSSDGTMGSETIAKAIKKARKDTNVKAIVLRVNSPGGSALASDVMWREVTLAKAEKPFIVSMGDLAASGGYFISCAADKIYANETTITGSIGVFGLIPVTENFFKNKMGIVFQSEETNEHSIFMDGISRLEGEEYDVVNGAIINIYEDFISKVADGRGMTPEEVNEVARGRVWTGTDALEIGLVDEIGTLDDAIAYAATQANLETYRVKELPVKKDPLEEMFKNFQMSITSTFMEQTLGEHFRYVELIKDVQGMTGVQARLPYLIEVY